jgi:hypothetical protein
MLWMRDRDLLIEETLARVADFEATQHKFQREREEYFRKTMEKVRSKPF